MILVIRCRSTPACEVKKKAKQISDYFKHVKANGDVDFKALRMSMFDSLFVLLKFLSISFKY